MDGAASTARAGGTGRVALVVHLVPALRPPPEGVGEFALALARALAARTGVASRFVVCQPDWPGGPEVAGFEATALAARSPGALGEAVTAALANGAGDRADSGRSAAVLLHYSGYGYDPRSRPDWLAAGLEAVRQRLSGPLVTTFHEVFATGPPWTRAFWDSRRQRSIARRLLDLSDAAVTSLELYAGLLRPWAGDPVRRPVEVIPVGSTVGEPAAVPPLEERPPRMVVFGGSGNRRRVYGAHREALAAACHSLGLEEIVDLGPDPAVAPDRLLGLPIARLGAVDDERVRQVLFGARAGFLAYAPAFFPKSTVFAAYCAHGLVPAAGAAHDREAAAIPNGLRPGHHFWAPGVSDGPDRGRAIAEAARAWYREHTFERQADLYLRLFAGTGDGR